MEITTRRVAARVIRLDVAGEIDMATVGTFETAADAAVQNADEVVVDFAGVTFCDSSGIAALDRAYAAATARNAVFRLINVQPGVRRVLAITGLLETLTDP